MTTHAEMVLKRKRRMARIEYVAPGDGDVCAECCEAVERITANGTLIGRRRAYLADEAVGQCEWHCKPMESHRYARGGERHLSFTDVWGG